MSHDDKHASTHGVSGDDTLSHSILSSLSSDDHTQYTKADGTRAFTGAQAFAVGTLALPGITFSGDTDTGIYHPAANQVAISCGNTQACLWSSSQMRVRDGSAAAPGIAWISATSLGFHRINGTTIGFAAGSSSRIQFSDAALTSTVPVLAPDGTVGAPAMAFSSDTDTGLFRVAENTLALATGGSNRLAVSSTAITLGLHVEAQFGSAAAPSYSFETDADTGIYRSAEDTLGITAGGTLRLSVSGTYVTSTLPVVMPVGAVGASAMTFTGDLDTGLYQYGADVVGITAGGEASCRFGHDIYLGTASNASARTVALGESDLTANRGSQVAINGRNVGIYAYAKDVSSGNQAVSIIAQGATGHAGTVSALLYALKNGGSGTAIVSIQASTRIDVGTSDGDDCTIAIGTSSTTTERTITVGERDFDNTEAGRGSTAQLFGRTVYVGAKAKQSTATDQTAMLYAHGNTNHSGALTVGIEALQNGGTGTARVILYGDSSIVMQTNVVMPKSSAELATYLTDATVRTIILVPGQTYDLSGTPVTVGAAKRIIGSAASGAFPVIRFTADSASNYLTTAYPLTIDGVKFSDSWGENVPQYPIRFVSGSSGSKVNGCRFELDAVNGSDYAAIIYINASQVEVADCTFGSCPSDTTYGSLFYVYNAADVEISNCDCGAVTCRYSVVSDAATDLLVEDCYFIASGSGVGQIRIKDGAVRNILRGNRLINNSGALYPLLFLEEQTTYVGAHRITQNVFQANRGLNGWDTTEKLVVLDQQKCVFSDNYIEATYIGYNASYLSSVLFLAKQADICLVGGNRFDLTSCGRAIWVGGSAGANNQPIRVQLIGNAIDGIGISSGVAYGILISAIGTNENAADQGVCCGNSISVTSGHVAISGNIQGTLPNSYNADDWTITGNFVGGLGSGILADGFTDSVIIGNSDSSGNAVSGSSTNNQVGTAGTTIPGVNH